MREPTVVRINISTRFVLHCTLREKRACLSHIPQTYNTKCTQLISSEKYILSISSEKKQTGTNLRSYITSRPRYAPNFHRRKIAKHALNRTTVVQSAKCEMIVISIIDDQKITTLHIVLVLEPTSVYFRCCFGAADEM